MSDTGIGLTPEQLCRVFEPFDTTKPEGNGPGLGLAVSSGIVRNHEGTLAAFSAPGKGSMFVVSFPITDVPPGGLDSPRRYFHSRRARRRPGAARKGWASCKDAR